tara:strand:- start:659 stop:859 length:201 start_codon:yes stop_codon:yes gene_type:complete
MNLAITQIIKKGMIFFKKYNRCLLHKRYVEKRVTDLRNEICRDAILYGKVDSLKRELLLKYNHKLK